MSAGLYLLALGAIRAPRPSRESGPNTAGLRGLFAEKPNPDFTEEERAVLRDVENQLALHRDQPRDEEPATEQRNCPECNRASIIVRIEDVEVDYCVSCEGCWFDPGELRAITGLSEDVPAADLAHRRSRFHCPDCAVEMTEHVFLQPYNLLVDRCPSCHGVYLERGELKRAFELTPAPG